MAINQTLVCESLLEVENGSSHESFDCMTLDLGVILVIFPLQEPCGVFRAFLEIQKIAELKSYITFLSGVKRYQITYTNFRSVMLALLLYLQ